ncbi:hypothetical protein ASPFODRAFT_52482 [Aspergillus luchuensis CBS 106.47]|uniref:Uncharacterized protein n=1 Tax=Aspergillus luchuensis (strain CBS 106.47) TaxID=1137211 RepID=A0A1M3T259_ASPLC|nr:hypothetical protein ASPFODRAFT_52482 [Aspergillus luchuensis CBS 106.47]
MNAPAKLGKSRHIQKGKSFRQGLEILLVPVASAIIGVATSEVLYFSSNRWPPRVPLAPYQPQSLEEVQAMNQRPKRGFQEFLGFLERKEKENISPHHEFDGPSWAEPYRH